MRRLEEAFKGKGETGSYRHIKDTGCAEVPSNGHTHHKRAVLHQPIAVATQAQVVLVTIINR